MTKDNLETKIYSTAREFANAENCDRLVCLLDDFFSQNVCIPKGANRHPYADVLHEWIEGAEIQQQFHENDIWYDRMETAIDQFDISYRIKPPEPVYEWQWLYKAMSYDDWNLSKYMVDSESSYLTHKYKLKLEETKRERK